MPDVSLLVVPVDFSVCLRTTLLWKGLQKDYIVVYYIDFECSYQVREPLSFKARTVTCMSKRIMYVQKTFRSLLGGSDENTVSIPMLSLLKRLNDAYFPGISPVPLQ